jgi:hypothetical protein
MFKQNFQTEKNKGRFFHFFITIYKQNKFFYFTCLIQESIYRVDSGNNANISNICANMLYCSELIEQLRLSLSANIKNNMLNNLNMINYL